MKKIVCLSLTALFLFSCGAYAQDHEWPSVKELRSYYNPASVVAHVKFQKAETVDKLGDYVINHIRCQVIEPFKGGLEKGQLLDFYSMADKDYKLEWYSGEKIIFLEKYYDREKKKWAFNQLENSWADPTQDVIQKMREIKSSNGRR